MSAVNLPATVAGALNGKACLPVQPAKRLSYTRTAGVLVCGVIFPFHEGSSHFGVVVFAEAVCRVWWSWNCFVGSSAKAGRLDGWVLRRMQGHVVLAR